MATRAGSALQSNRGDEAQDLIPVRRDQCCLDVNVGEDFKDLFFSLVEKQFDVLP